MAKAMSVFGMVIAALLLLAFTLDFVAGVPFGGLNSTMDIGFIVASAILGYMGFDAFRAAN